MKKYVCPMTGYLIDIKNIEINKNTVVVCQHPDTKQYVKMYKGVITLGNNLLTSDTSNRNRKWLEKNKDGDGFVIYSKWGDREPVASSPVTDFEILIDENFNSPDIYQFPTDDDAKLFMDLIRKEHNDEEKY